MGCRKDWIHSGSVLLSPRRNLASCFLSVVLDLDTCFSVLQVLELSCLVQQVHTATARTRLSYVASTNKISKIHSFLFPGSYTDS